MRSGICPKCGSSNICKCQVPKCGASHSVYDTEQLSMFKVAYSVRYVCFDCGYTERYFEDEQLEKLKEKYFNK